MSMVIKMRGDFDTIRVRGSHVAFAAAMNVAAAQGMEFISLEKPDGGLIGIATHNILTFEEIDDDADILG